MAHPTYSTRFCLAKACLAPIDTLINTPINDVMPIDEQH